MNPITQPDRHPDAESLNAFVEHALRDAERVRIVAHMAGCARCREVVYLAQAAAEAEAALVADIKAEPRPGWIAVALAKWRIALIPAAAMAATGAVVLWVQLRPVPPRAEMAQIAPQQSAQVTAPADAPGAHQATAPPIAGPTSASGASSAHQSRRAEQRPEPKKAKPATPGPAAGFSSSEQVARNAPVPSAATPFGPSQVAGGYHLDAHSAAMARKPAQPQQPNRSAEMPFETALTKPVLQPPQSANMTPASRNSAMAAKTAASPQPPNIVVFHGAAAAPGSGGPEPLTAPAVPPSAQFGPQPLSGLAAQRLVRHAKLPSGLNVVSSAAVLNRLVALDSAGAVFLSQDAGKHWDAVHPQWSGKAIAVRAPAQGLYQVMPAAGPESLDTAGIVAPPTEEKRASPNVNATVSSPPPPPPAPASGPAVTVTAAAPPIPAMLFKLITDTHQTWVSADGKVWRQQ